MAEKIIDLEIKSVKEVFKDYIEDFECDGELIKTLTPENLM